MDKASIGKSPLTAKVPVCSLEVTAERDGRRASEYLKLSQGVTSNVDLMLVSSDERGGREARRWTADPLAVGVSSGHPRWAVRAGVAGAAGTIGVAVEWRPSWWGLSIGTGYMPLGLALNLGSARNDGGLFLDGYATVVARSFVYNPVVRGLSVGFNVGWDWRTAPGWSVKTGIGLSGSTLPLEGRGGFSWDLTVGRVF